METVAVDMAEGYHAADRKRKCPPHRSTAQRISAPGFHRCSSLSYT
jgi:hypothetical protein